MGRHMYSLTFCTTLRFCVYFPLLLEFNPNIGAHCLCAREKIHKMPPKKKLGKELATEGPSQSTGAPPLETTHEATHPQIPTQPSTQAVVTNMNTSTPTTQHLNQHQSKENQEEPEQDSEEEIEAVIEDELARLR
jgi:hypothetical protein